MTNEKWEKWHENYKCLLCVLVVVATITGCYRLTMLLDEDDVARKKPVQKNLELMGVEELQAYIDSLKSEIMRAEAEIVLKSKARQSAASFFKP